MPTALITGVGGQDGGYLAERLLADGVEVHALALPGDDVPVPGVHLHIGDVTDLDATRATVLEVAPDEVYNLAGLSSVARSWDEPDLSGPIPADLVERALAIRERQVRAQEQLSAALGTIARQHEFATRVDRATRRESPAVYVDVSA